MNREEYQNVKEIFQTVLEIPLAERAAFLDEKCADDLTLRREVERLLGAFDSEYLERPAVENVAEAITGKSKLSDGEEFGHYRIIKKLGHGGMGEVFLAEDLRLNRKIALKILPLAVSQNENYQRRFKQEARAASALNHPNILTIYEFGTINGTNFIAAEFIEGKTLREFIGTGQRLLTAEVLEMARQIALALSSAHESGVFHRDIKPENVMIRADGLVKVLDFGLAKLSPEVTGPAFASATGPVTTLPGMMMGTPAYMSPEQTRGKIVDARSDIFSFGVVLYELLTGRRPFKGADAIENSIAILRDEPPPINSFRPDVTPEIARIVRKALRKNSDERYPTAKDMLADLSVAKRELELHESPRHISAPNRDYQTTQKVHTTSTDKTQPAVNRSSFQSRPKRRAFLYLPLAFLLLAGIVFGYFKFYEPQPVSNSQESVRIRNLTDTGNIGEPVALSRDGKWLVFAVRAGNTESVWLKQVAAPDSNTQIVPPAAVQYRAFTISPGGNFLYFSIADGHPSKCSLYSMPLLGGASRRILSGINGGVSFSPDEKHITYGVEDLEKDESILMVANADGTEERELVRMKGNDEIGSSRGRWSPDGKSIAVFVGTNNPRTQELATVSVATGEITRLNTHKVIEFAYWDWLADGKGLIVLGRDKTASSNQFWEVSLDSGSARKLTNDVDSYASMSLAADANMIATTRVRLTSDIWVAPVDETPKASKISPGSDQSWTPDGKLVFTRKLGERLDIYSADANGGSAARLTSDSNFNHSPSVSTDGRYVVYVAMQNGTPFIFRMDIDGRNPKQLTSEFSFNPSISPDGTEIIYEAGSDNSTIWKVGIDGGVPVQLTQNQARNPVFSPDGEFFLCSWWENPNEPSKFAIISSDGGPPIRIFPSNDRLSLRWMPDGRSFAYVKKTNGFDNVWTEPVTGGAAKQLTSFPGLLLDSFEFSPDGKRIAINAGVWSSDVMIISGFGR